MEGARECAIEICSFSKIAGFTGTRCGYTIVPHELEREGMNLNKLWLRRQTTKFNGVPYVVQRAAAAVFTESGMAEIQANLDYYRQNAKVIADALDECGVWYCGGKNSPYIWLRCPGGMKSWEFFDWLLENCGVVGTPGVGFGECGEGYFRLTAFGDAEKTKVAAQRIKPPSRLCKLTQAKRRCSFEQLHRLFLLFPARQPVEQHHCQNNDADDEDDADHPDQHHRQRGHPRSKMKHAITSVKPSGSGSGRLQ